MLFPTTSITPTELLRAKDVEDLLGSQNGELNLSDEYVRKDSGANFSMAWFVLRI